MTKQDCVGIWIDYITNTSWKVTNAKETPGECKAKVTGCLPNVNHGGVIKFSSAHAASLKVKKTSDRFFVNNHYDEDLCPMEWVGLDLTAKEPDCEEDYFIAEGDMKVNGGSPYKVVFEFIRDEDEKYFVKCTVGSVAPTGQWTGTET